ncbi:ATP-binding protein [Saccharothrix xinjiangensis]|uniref:ATP-binding protein n=1 Tax=Saccharothrix xinjiangensis TaxID=204798 RepID=A0ABV9Y0U5_9PSEU
MVEFRVLGPVEVVHAGRPLALGGPRHRRLLAALLLRAGDVVPAGTLVHALWGDAPPRSARAMLHVRTSELRAALRIAEVRLSSRAGGYVLGAGPEDVDAWRFERLAAAGAAALAAGEPGRARDDLGAGLALWRGPALAEFADEPFARPDVARLGELRLRALENRVAADLDLGRHAELVAELGALVAENPLRERFWGQLVLALYRTGRQGEALRAYESVRLVMADQLGLDPGGELRALHAAVLRQASWLDPPRAVRRLHVLPAAVTSFVGRRRELPGIRALLREHRLVTLTGAGGAGKSRLAVEAAGVSAPDFPAGAALVDLAAVTRPGCAVPAVAAVLDVRERLRRPLFDALAERIGGERLLLVLDNCEHLVDEVGEVALRLLRRCPELRVLVTSRERLGLIGEAVRPVPGLGLPAVGAAGVDAIGRADAVRLVVDRVSAVDPDFRLTEVTAGAVAEICRRLDGLPLAIELAVAGVRTWGVRRIAASLDDPFRLPVSGSCGTSGRHRTLRAVVDWSYDLLDDAQRRLFDRLAVFAGGFTAQAVEAVCGGAPGDGPPVAEVLAGLVDKSLVAVDHTGVEPRYRMLGTLRAYASERLAESGGVSGTAGGAADVMTATSSAVITDGTADVTADGAHGRQAAHLVAAVASAGARRGSARSDGAEPVPGRGRARRSGRQPASSATATSVTGAIDGKSPTLVAVPVSTSIE